MTKLITDNQFANPDAAYNRIIDAHRDLTEDQSQTLNAKLILLLANHIGDMGVLEEALVLAEADE